MNAHLCVSLIFLNGTFFLGKIFGEVVCGEEVFHYLYKTVYAEAYHSHQKPIENQKDKVCRLIGKKLFQTLYQDFDMPSYTKECCQRTFLENSDTVCPPLIAEISECLKIHTRAFAEIMSFAQFRPTVESSSEEMDTSENLNENKLDPSTDPKLSRKRLHSMSEQSRYDKKK